MECTRLKLYLILWYVFFSYENFQEFCVECELAKNVSLSTDWFSSRNWVNLSLKKGLSWFTEFNNSVRSRRMQFLTSLSRSSTTTSSYSFFTPTNRNRFWYSHLPMGMNTCHKRNAIQRSLERHFYTRCGVRFAGLKQSSSWTIWGLTVVERLLKRGPWKMPSTPHLQMATIVRDWVVFHAVSQKGDGRADPGPANLSWNRESVDLRVARPMLHS